MRHSLLMLVLFLSGPSFADISDGCEKVTAQIAQLDQNIQKLRTTFAAQPGVDLAAPEWVRKYLTMLVAVDQAVRVAAMEWPATQGYDDAQTMCFWTMLAPRWERIDDESTAALANLMELHHWITAPKFGDAAADDAWLLAQHADRHRPFQRRVLQILAELYPKREVPARHYAYLEDRLSAYADSKPQRFGTQGSCLAKNNWQPAPIEAPEQLDERRKAMGLGTFAKQKARLDAICL